ncbi:histone H1-like repetitive region-containing protein [Gordonia insulae]|uniref:Heparin-binding hemagglutinin n=1 Tax=Gordonia insulae TaxID=2420509 RepID=A0A3G8JMJ3_9ACTN|nr:histone H1-like repetitive region-containing protein [Gordonia insulae]AZG46118.1 Heparin-binding hemagglutinin [Gordonia insulae]
MPENPLTPVIEQVTALLTDLRERSEAAGEEAQKRLGKAQTKAQSRVDETRDSALAIFEDARTRLSALPVELPADIDDLVARFGPDELRKVAEAYLAVAAGLLTALSERGEEVVGRLKSQPLVEENLPKLEKVYNDAVGITEEALGSISGQTRAVGERAAALAGLTTSKADEVVLEPAKKVVAKTLPGTKAPAKTAPAKKAPAKKVAATKAPATKVPAKKAAAKKTPATKAAAKKTPATKAGAKKTAAKKTAAKKIAAKKTAAKKTAAKKAPAKKAASGRTARKRS